MIPRKPLAPNNRKKVSLGSEFAIAKAYDKSPTNKGSVFKWARAGRQTASGFGGGRIISKN
jgi:hypothetical protein